MRRKARLLHQLRLACVLRLNEIFAPRNASQMAETVECNAFIRVSAVFNPWLTLFFSFGCGCTALCFIRASRIARTAFLLRTSHDHPVRPRCHALAARPRQVLRAAA